MFFVLRFEVMAFETVGRLMEILLVEDSVMFARLAIGALNKGGVQHHLTWLTDGADAWQFLQRTGVYVNAPRPDLLLLDLKLPGIDGTELLSRVRHNNAISTLPVIVMTGETDSFLCHDLPVEAFLTKPLEYEQFCKIVVQLSEFWKADMMIPLNTSLVPKSEEER